MSSWFVCLVGCLFLAGSLACSIPLEVKRVHPPALAVAGETAPPVNGVRYRLMRPVTSASLRMKAAATPDQLELMGTRSAGTCRGYAVELVLAQEMKETWIYEAEYTPNLLADTDVTMSLLEDGALSSVSAGETDQILPFIEAVLGVAVSAATLGVDALDGGSCAIPAVQALVAKQLGLKRQQLALEERRDAWRTALQGRRVDYEKAREGLAALDSELVRVKTEMSKNRHVLAPTEALICIDAKPLIQSTANVEACAAPPAPTSHWIRIDLMTEG